MLAPHTYVRVPVLNSWSTGSRWVSSAAIAELKAEEAICGTMEQAPLVPGVPSAASVAEPIEKTIPAAKPQAPTPPATSSTTSSGTRYIPMYDFARFLRVYNNGQPIRWPRKGTIIRFFRPEVDDTDEEIKEQHLEEAKEYGVSIEDAASILPEEFTAPTLGGTKHEDALFLGLEYKPDGDVSRYLIKFFAPGPEAIKYARREVLLSHLLVECGESAHAPKITLGKIAGRDCLVRRFYKGADGRILADATLSELQDMGIDIPAESAVRLFALRYVLFGDLDFHNTGNVIFTRHSTISNKIVQMIDGEFIMPNEECMKDMCSLDPNSTWEPGDPIPGSFLWRKMMSEEMGRDRFFEAFLTSENPFITYLRLLLNNNTEQIGSLPLYPHSVKRVLDNEHFIEQLARTFDAAPVADLVARNCDFHQTLDAWRSFIEHRPNSPITLKQLITADYDV